jgi:Zn-dependent M28 family amino/carboxypeptidase
MSGTSLLTLSSDDGSGTIGILTVAKALAKFRVKNAVRFAFWSAEEFGLLGSYFYMNSINGSETELAKIRAYLNFDMVRLPFATHLSQG